MRISDWSSDVCSSDLAPKARRASPPGKENTAPSASSSVAPTSWFESPLFSNAGPTGDGPKQFLRSMSIRLCVCASVQAQFSPTSQPSARVPPPLSAVALDVLWLDRKCVVGGKGDPMRVDLGGGGI